jgi:hypothetical protein
MSKLKLFHIVRPTHSDTAGKPFLSPGDRVEVRSKEEILKTLDKNGNLDGLPFMPEMFEYCGRRLRVFKRAHKTCDTIYEYKGRKMNDAVHLEGVRCNGQAHGGCEASCLIFWKTAWLRTLEQPAPGLHAVQGSAPQAKQSGAEPCTEADVLAASWKPESGPDDTEPAYACQTTQLLVATQPLPWWEPRQYIEDYTSGNVALSRITKSFAYRAYRKYVVNLGIGIGRPMKWLYNTFQRIRGGTPYPSVTGKLPAGSRTPALNLNLQPGEWVRVKQLDDILATCEVAKNTNRGMTFDSEMVPHVGGTYRVLKRVRKILNEQTGKMQYMKNPCIILDGVMCEARYSQCRLFCPRSIYLYWREIWLERVESNGAGKPNGSTSLQANTIPAEATVHSRDKVSVLNR